MIDSAEPNRVCLWHEAPASLPDSPRQLLGGSWGSVSTVFGFEKIGEAQLRPSPASPCEVAPLAGHLAKSLKPACKVAWRGHCWTTRDSLLFAKGMQVVGIEGIHFG